MVTVHAEVPTKPAVTYDVEAYYDGDCPLCTKEVAMLRSLDRHGRIRFTDFTAPGFDATALGLTHDDLMARMHGQLPDGTLIEGVEVFRRLYGAVGFGPVVALTRLPVLSQACDMAYHLFARNRLRLTGRCHNGACDLLPAGGEAKTALR